ncbi:MAG: ABC transporter ATP-binding protein/permease [Lentisphaeria bacterium]|nr:ABC transporter ATP-binding protein/permease [Lentisphaeria bacterium]
MIKKLLAPYKAAIVFVVIATLVISGIGAAMPMLTSVLVDRVFTNRQMNVFLVLGLCYFLGPVLQQFFFAFQRTMAILVAVFFAGGLRFAVYRHLLGLSLRFFNVNSAGKVVNRVMEDTQTIVNIILSSATTTISDCVIASVSILATFAINWRLALLVCAIVVGFVINYRLSIKRIIRFTRLMRHEDDALTGGVQNRMSASIAVKTFGTEERENDVFHGHNLSSLEFGWTRDIANNNFWMNVSLIASLAQALLYFCGCAMVLKGQMTYGEVMAFNMYAMQLIWPGVRFSQLAGRLQEGKVALNRLFEYLQQVPEIQDCEKPVRVKKLQGNVDFEDVHFHYQEGVPIIRGITLHVKPGESIAFIGTTGCGKSTMLNLLTRFYDVVGGRILLDGIDIRDYSLKDLHRQFGIVLQESYIFSVSIRENIRYGRPHASDEEVVAAAKAAEIHDFIMALPEGYETRIGEDGAALSVGQKQRINIARAICADPAIMIMDEATSSLDSDSEAAIQRGMERLLKGRTSFVVAHRLSTIRNASQIVFIDKGVVIEHGTHEELMAIENGRYRELYTKHMGKGVLDDA